MQVTNPYGSREQYEYDSRSNRSSLVVENAEGSSRTDYTYDLNNRLIASVEAGEETRYTYDAAGNMTAKVTPEGSHSYQYDGLTRLVGYQNQAECTTAS